jgi:hypothetical protein
LTITSGTSPTIGGGGILNHGALTLTSCTISKNTAGTAYGGGIFNDGTLVVTNSTISGNSSSSGGSIYNTGTLTLTSSTNAGNSSCIDNSGTLTLTNSTIGDCPVPLFMARPPALMWELSRQIIHGPLLRSHRQACRLVGTSHPGFSSMKAVLVSK